MNIFLKYSQYLSLFEKYYLILKVFIVDIKSCFLFITFLNSHLIIDVKGVKLDKFSCSFKNYIMNKNIQKDMRKNIDW